MTKSERLEHLQKKREETYRNAQKMTIFVKVKDDNLIQGENDFMAYIKNYLMLIFGKEYAPRSIKLRFETKSAFITMNSQRDTEEFIRKYAEYAKENPTALFFNLYKSKVERISANSYFRKYNNFNTDGQLLDSSAKQSGYRKYNEGLNISQPQIGQTVRYNNFDEMGSNMQSMQNMQNVSNMQSMPYRGYVTYNNFNNMPNGVNPNMMNQKIEPKLQPAQTNLDPHDEEAIGEYLYSFAERLYPE